MDQRTRYLIGAGVVALAATFSMTVRGPENGLFLFLIAACLGLRAQNA